MLTGIATAGRIDRLVRTVADLARSVDFYRGALGFEHVPAVGASMTGRAALQLGEQHVDLVVADDPCALPVAAKAPDPRFQHAAIVTSDMQASWQRLDGFATVAISRGGPQQLPARAGGVTAFKFRDPDGHPLELLQFPSGTGHPQWQSLRAGGPNLGIDHFAIAVASVERSTAFFATKLGHRIVARGVSHGPEQDRLDGLDGVEVDVVTLRPRRGAPPPHFELLHYRRPRVAASPSATTPSFNAARDEIACRVSSGLPSGSAALSLVDPDGHRFLAAG